MRFGIPGGQKVYPERPWKIQLALHALDFELRRLVVLSWQPVPFRESLLPRRDLTPGRHALPASDSNHRLMLSKYRSLSSYREQTRFDAESALALVLENDP